jgi:hypothetical protein
VLVVLDRYLHREPEAFTARFCPRADPAIIVPWRERGTSGRSFSRSMIAFESSVTRMLLRWPTGRTEIVVSDRVVIYHVAISGFGVENQFRDLDSGRGPHNPDTGELLKSLSHFILHYGASLSRLLCPL